MEEVRGLFVLGTALSIFFLSANAIHVYYAKKEYSSTKYELKKKIIRIEEDNTVKLDTVYTFKHK